MNEKFNKLWENLWENVKESYNIVNDILKESKIQAGSMIQAALEVWETVETAMINIIETRLILLQRDTRMTPIKKILAFIDLASLYTILLQQRERKKMLEENQKIMEDIKRNKKIMEELK